LSGEVPTGIIELSQMDVVMSDYIYSLPHETSLNTLAKYCILTGSLFRTWRLFKRGGKLCDKLYQAVTREIERRRDLTKEADETLGLVFQAEEKMLQAVLRVGQ
jgi:hypothetical protein